MLLWITLIAVVWLALMVIVVAVCRAAAMGDRAEVLPADRTGRFGRPARRLQPRRRTHA